MFEAKIINRELAHHLAKQGHKDTLLICDAGFPIPVGRTVIDLSLSENVPLVDDVMEEISQYYSVEKIIHAQETVETSPPKYQSVMRIYKNIETEILSHKEFKEKSATVKLIIRAGDFTAYSNFSLVSGAGERWYLENS